MPGIKPGATGCEARMLSIMLSISYNLQLILWLLSFLFFPALRVFEAMETSGTTDLRNPETPRQSARWSSQVSTNLFEGNHFELKFTVIEKLWQCHQYFCYSTPALLEWLHQLGCVGLIPFSSFYRLLTLFDVSVMVMFDECEDRSMCLGPIFFSQQGPHQVFKNPTLFPGQWLVKQGSARAYGR